MDILHLLTQPEGKTLEFKENLSSPRGVLRTIVAFANTAGGTVIIGVEDKSKHIFGVVSPYDLEEKLANLIDDHITPQILPEIEIVPWRNLYLLVVQVFPSSVRPHYIRQDGPEKGVYIRVGSTNRVADEIMQSELQRIKIIDSFDKQPMSALNSEAIDFRVASELFSSVRTLTKGDLESLMVVTTHQGKQVPTVGGIILFGKERLHYFPEAWIQVGRFSGITKSNIFDTQEITSYPILAIDEVMSFIKKHAMHGIEISGLRHKETWSLPIAAVREAIINAVVHADYAQHGAPIRLSIFDNRIEIENPGLLLFGLTIEEIKCGVSKLRNRVIGQVFYRLGLIERWGSGIRRIVDSCIEAGFAEPLFEEIGTHFRVTLYTEPVNSPTLDKIELTIISVLKALNGASTKEISEKIGLSSRATRVRLTTLIEKGIIVAVGSGTNDPKRKYFFKDKKIERNSY